VLLGKNKSTFTGKKENKRTASEFYMAPL